MTKPCEYLEEMGEDIALLNTRQEQLLALRQYGDYLDSLDAAHKTDDNLVPGCASATHIIVALQDDGTLKFSGDSESFISKGYIYLLIEAFNGATPEFVLKEARPCVQRFAEQAGVRLSTLQSRANVFENVFSFMQRKTAEALAQQGA